MSEVGGWGLFKKTQTYKGCVGVNSLECVSLDKIKLCVMCCVNLDVSYQLQERFSINFHVSHQKRYLLKEQILCL